MCRPRIAISKLFDSIAGLSQSNFLTGVWDNRRNDLCKKPFERFTEKEKAYLYHTEKMSRSNVEKRAEYRRNIEKYWKIIVASNVRTAIIN